MVFKISKILEKGKFNWKGLKNILHDHEARLDALENGSTTTGSSVTSINSRLDAIEERLGALESPNIQQEI